MNKINSTTAFESMNIKEMTSVCPSFVSARKQDGRFCKKNRPFRHFIRGALDRYLKAPPYNKRFSICDKAFFSEAIKH